MKNYLLTISYHNEQVASATYKQLMETMIVDPCEVYVLDNNCPLVKDKQFLKNLCDKYGFKYFNVGKNLGLQGGWNYLISQLPEHCDRVILLDGDGYPVTLNWHIPLLKIHDNSSVVWGSLKNNLSFGEMQTRGFTSSVVEGYKVRITKTPVVNSICSFKLSWLKSINGITEPNRFYGGVEMSLWSKKKKEELWVFLEEFEETPHPIQQDKIYGEYKWAHAHEGLDISFEEFIELKEVPAHSLESLEILRKSPIGTFHHHFYIILDILNSIKKDKINYVEIGCYAGASATLSLHNPKVSTISIDGGVNVPKEKVISDVLAIHPGREFTYIEGNSHDKGTFHQLKAKLGTSKIDVLFIDGGHSYQDVIQDFDMYSTLVAVGGYIIFDDYSDYKFSPDVKPAVDSIVKDLKGYNIIGCFDNTFDAKVAYPMDKNNCFVIKKLR